LNGKAKLLNTIVFLILLIAACCMVLPFLWMVLTSLKSNMEIVSTPATLFPKHSSFEGYRTVIQDAPFLRWLFNSAYTSVIITVVTIFTSALGGYIFAKFEFRGKRILFILILATMMIPFQVIMIPTYLIISKIGLIDHLSAIILPSLVSAYGVFMARQFIGDIPKDLMEAARLDGAGEMRILWSVMMPLVVPMLSALGIFTFMASWNNYLWPLIVLNDTNNMTVPMALVYFNGSHLVNFNVVMSAAVLIMIPVIAVYLIFQKQFIKGLTMTGMK
jgi:multiple sugar transport system permease protein